MESERNEDNDSEAETVQIPAESTTKSNIETNDVREPTASQSQSEGEEEAMMSSVGHSGYSEDCCAVFQYIINTP